MTRILYLGNTYFSLFQAEAATGSLNIEHLEVTSADGFLTAAKLTFPDFILIDYDNPFSWRELLEYVRPESVIVLGTNTSESAPIDVFRHGASDYIPMTEIASFIGNLAGSRHQFPTRPLYNELRFQKIVESSADGIFIIDQNGMISYSSPSVTTILGYDPGEITGRNLIEFLHPDDHIGVQEKIAEALLLPGEIIEGHTGRMRHKNGQWRWIEAIGKNMLHDPLINGIIDTFRDVTDSVEIFQRQKRGEELLNNTLDALALNIALLNEKGMVVAVNKAWTEFALSNGETALERVAVGADYMAVCKAGMESGDSFSETAYNGLNDIFSGRAKEFTMEYPCDSPTQKRWFVMQAKRFAGDENKVVVAHIDISLRRQAEEKLKASELKFRLLLEQNRDGIALLDETLKPTYVSPAIFEILGYDVDQIQGVDLLSLVHPEDVETIQQVVAQAMATPGVPTKPKVTRMKSRAGEWKYIEGTLNNMLHDPAINAVIDNFRDITPEKLALEKLVKANRFSSISGGIGQILAHAPDEQTLFDDVCEVAVKLGGYLAAAVGLINPETLQLEAKASNGFPDDGDFDVTSYLEPDKLNSILHGHSTFEMFTQSDQPERGQIFDRGMALPLKRHGQAVGVFFVYSNNASHFDADESVLLMQVTSEIAFTIDLLENDRARRKTENELRIQNAKLRQAQKIAKLGTWEVDLENAVATWSVELLNMYGFPPEQANISYRDWLDRVHPDDRANFDLSRERAQNAKTGYSITHRIVRTDGHIRNVVSQLNFELDENGKAVFLIGVTQDITDFQEIMQALRASEKAFMQSESRYRQIVEMANEGICLLNEKNQIVFANSRLSEILGYTSEEFYNENLLSFQYTRNHNIEIAVRRILATQSAGVVELCLRSKNGDPVWANVALSIVADDFGETRGFVALISNITQKREAEQSNKFKAHLLNNISQAVVATNKSGVVKYWNKAAEKLYKRDASDVIGLKFKEVVDPSRMEMASEMWESSKKGNDWSGDIEMKNERGQSLAYQVTSQPIYDQREKYDGMLAVTTDVTEQRTLERLLEWSARLAKLGHFEIDVVNNTLIRSKLTMEILRATHSVEPDVANALGSYKPGVSRDTVLNAYQDALKYGKDWDFEAQLDTDDESEIWVRLIGKVEMVNGQTVRIFGSVQDITAQKLSEKAVLNAFQERDLIFESIGDAFFAVDQNWSLNYLNGKAESVLLKKREDILGKNLWEVFPEYVGTETFHHYHKAMETQTSVEFDEFFFSFQKWLEVSVFPSPLGLSIYFKDVTERKLAELQMVELNENLQEYTNDLVAANRELRQFSYIVSHNLRGPVTNIIGLARELGDNSYDAETQALFVKSLKSSAERLDNVITDLNDVLQLKSGGVEMKEKIELSTAVDVVIKTIQNQIASESGRVDTDFSSVDEIVTVKSYLHSIIHNLVLNAVKYRKPDVPPVIRITSAETRDGIELQISDNGLGMDLTRTKNDLFGMYKRFHFHVEGKGIGLFMVKTQIEILGGTISVDSALGQGTTFRLFFPR